MLFEKENEKLDNPILSFVEIGFGEAFFCEL
jgi:hypothetical protein